MDRLAILDGWIADLQQQLDDLRRRLASAKAEREHLLFLARKESPLRDYGKAREEHAYRLRKEGLTFVEIGSRFGVSAYSASRMMKAHDRRVRRQLRGAQGDA